MKEALKLYLVTDRSLSLGRTLQEVVTEAVAGGVTMVQLREKEASTGEMIVLAKQLQEILKPLNIPLIINDRVDVALAVDADGVHIGQSDMPYNIARELLGPDKIIGLSVESLDDIRAANRIDVDYIGISPVFATPTKLDTSKPFGINGLKEAVRLSTHPTVAIGGMNRATIKDVMLTGCDGVAVVSAISSAESPKKASEELKSIVNSNSQTLWSQKIWRESNKIYNAIIEQDFIKELAKGRLSIDKFSRYIAQDELYLKEYYPQMLKVAEMLYPADSQQLFKEIALSGMEGEKLMHNFLIDKYGIESCSSASEVTSGYLNTINEGIASDNICIALAVMLPCMWIYNQVGLHILKIADLDNNPYKEWIMEYGNEEFTQGVNSVLDIIDNLANSADNDTINKMSHYYLRAALFEYAFWDYGYNGESKSYDYSNSLKEWI